MEATVKDFKVGDVVQHLFTGRYATVTKVGRKYLHVNIHLADVKVSWFPTSVRKIEKAGF